MISPIRATDWTAIVEIQAEVYHAVEPESLSVLQAKWLMSPETCFVYRDVSGEIGGYLLAHRWHSETPPKLYQQLAAADGHILFLHDLAISQRLAGQGAGRAMVEHLLAVAKTHGYQQSLLVSVQDSVQFWQKFGYTETNQIASASYGEGAAVMINNLV
ncbi:GNAT family N-acetyltransferase [Pseudoalteromonas fenneropenaei]|uniref:GNAT family N-acetyltransferase n=1 Tax=Pseudoalteromonas fenneropenaei TaxID=1737459 RepID=A0ABV7CN32_9GAMM